MKRIMTIVLTLILLVQMALPVSAATENHYELADYVYDAIDKLLAYDGNLPYYMVFVQPRNNVWDTNCYVHIVYSTSLYAYQTGAPIRRSYYPTGTYGTPHPGYTVTGYRVSSVKNNVAYGMFGYQFIELYFPMGSYDQKSGIGFFVEDASTVKLPDSILDSWKENSLVINIGARLVYTELDALLLQASQLDVDKYTASSVTTFKLMLAYAKEVRLTASEQSQVNDMVVQLQSAIDSLVLKADFTQLNSVIDIARQKQEEVYTPITWTAFKTAMTRAELVAGDDESTQTVVDSAGASLQAAMDNLTDRADFTALAALLDQAAGISNDGYSAATWNALQNMIRSSSASVANYDLSQQQVDAELARLQTAMTSLRYPEPGEWDESMFMPLVDNLRSNMAAVVAVGIGVFSIIIAVYLIVRIMKRSVKA